MRQTKVKAVMTSNPSTIDPEATLKEAARKMEELDCGVLPVGSQNRPEGVITDRDIVIRAISNGKDPNIEKVRDYMTPEVFHCSAEQTLEQAADLMREHNVNRLLVRDENERICGIVTFGCILRKVANPDEISNAVEHARPTKAA